jgi:hypothetical protein
MVEGGEYAGSIGVIGYPNGATVAFSIYALSLSAIAYFFATGRRGPQVPAVPGREANALFRRFSSKLLLLQIAFLVVFLFGFGAINTWSGATGKGEFRVGLGDFGAFPNSMSKFILPSLVAYAALLYRRTTRSFEMRVRLGLNLATVFLIGASWGFKTTAISGVLPTIVVLYWTVRPTQLLLLAVGFVASLVGFFFLFDANLGALGDVESLLMTRLTVLQGDVCWYVWDLHSTGTAFPNYWPTLLAAIGDKLLGVFGVNHADANEWMLFHYDWMVTFIAGAPLEQIEGGHSIVGAPFSEGLIAGGIPGLVVFTIIAGVLTGRMYLFIERALRQNRDVAAALGTTYFCYFLIPWLNAGAIVQLFHISLLINFGTALLALNFMRRRWVFEAPRPPPASDALPAALSGGC